MNHSQLCLVFLFSISIVSFCQDSNPTKLGIGIVSIQDTYDENKVVSFYKDSRLKSKVEDFKLYGDLKNINPYYFKPDYGLCYFVCLEKTENYFKVLINDREKGFLKNDADKYFKTWESILINSSVERLDIKSNPLRLNPHQNSGLVKLNYQISVDRLSVIDVVEIKGEHWLKVYYSKSGSMPCDMSSQDCGEGWIKWKAGDKLLVKILLLS